MDTSPWPRGRKVLFRFAITVAAVLVSCLLVQRASAQPPLPATFYGTVQLDGAGVSAGTTISAWINIQQYAQAQTLTYQGNPVYAIDVPGDDQDTPDVVEGGSTGDEVSFKVGGQVAIVTSTWHEGALNELDLVACTLLGDMDCNCTVNVDDIMKVAACLGEAYHLACDLDEDRDNDIADIQIVAGQWRNGCP